MALPVAGLLTAAAVLAVSAAAAYYQHQETLRQRKLWADWARKRGWRHEPESRTIFDGLTSAPFGRGHSRVASNVVIGRWNGLDFALYHYSHVEGAGRTARAVHHSVAQFAAGTNFPTLTIRPGPQSRLTDDITFEWDDFNEAFDVRSADERFAFTVVHPRFMTALHDGQWRGVNITFEKDVVTVWRDGLVFRNAATELPRHLARVVALVPAQAWTDHGGILPTVTDAGAEPVVDS